MRVTKLLANIIYSHPHLCELCCSKYTAWTQSGCDDCIETTCTAAPSKAPTGAPSSSPTTAGDCSLHPKCVAMEMEGLCCPAKDGVTYPGAKRPGRSRGVKIDAKRNQSS